MVRLQTPDGKKSGPRHWNLTGTDLEVSCWNGYSNQRQSPLVVVENPKGEAPYLSLFHIFGPSLMN